MIDSTVEVVSDLDFSEILTPTFAKTSGSQSGDIRLGTGWKIEHVLFNTDSDIEYLVETLTHENIHQILAWEFGMIKESGQWDRFDRYLMDNDICTPELQELGTGNCKIDARESHGENISP